MTNKKRKVFLTLLAVFCSMCSAQQYDAPDTRKQKSETHIQVEDQKKTANQRQPDTSLFTQKEAEAKEYLGKIFWYLPNPAANSRIRFYERLPASSHSADPNIIFTPLTTTSFVVTGVVMAPPLVYSIGTDEYLLEIKFLDEKVGYVNVVGCCGLSQNLYKGRRDVNNEYVSTESVDNILLRESVEQERDDRESVKKQQEIALEKKREEHARRAEMAKPYPRIGMTKEQVIKRTNWGAPNDINRTITAGGIREQWVFGIGRYLYFANGILTTIQD